MSVSTKIQRTIRICLAFLAALLIASACNLPAPGSVLGTPGTPVIPDSALTEVAGTVQAVVPGTPAISGSVLTQVAATLYAAVNATETQLALSPPPLQVEPSIEATSVGDGAPITGTPNPTATLTPLKPTATSTTAPIGAQPVMPSPTFIPLPLGTSQPIMPLPPPVGSIYSDDAFKVRGVNITWCGGMPWAIFRVYNSSKATFESLMLTFQDATTGSFLYGPFVSDYPFMWSDRLCEISGIDSLASKHTLYLGTMLGSPDVRGHTINTTITLCTKEVLTGTCFTKDVQFVMP